MKFCSNHQDKKALSICHGCGKDFCELCLDEGKEYYYCKKPECQKMFKEELPLEKLSENVICPSCGNEFILSEDEIANRKVHCPECEAMINYNYNPPKVQHAEKYVELLSSLNQGDISLIKSIFDDGDIDYYLVGDNMLSVRPLLDPVRFFVNESQAKDASDLLKNFDLHIFGFSLNQQK
jgi:hypothetical protein